MCLVSIELRLAYWNYKDTFWAILFIFFFSSRRRHTRWPRDWSSDVVLFRSRESGRCPRRGRPRRGDRPRQEGVEAEREDPPGTSVVLLLEGASPHPLGEEHEPGCRADRGPQIGRASCRESGEIAWPAVAEHA